MRPRTLDLSTFLGASASDLGAIALVIDIWVAIIVKGCVFGLILCVCGSFVRRDEEIGQISQFELSSREREREHSRILSNSLEFSRFSIQWGLILGVIVIVGGEWACA